ncbi:Fanconi anemia group M [Portunus trituberculatus]|uniref:Fanconi anemia group M n=1 Tax=Portunus trituberculatus TaxID=210409 RepID=A0A5B7CYG5_PORTR|nr:Fanconi anemia group M [Portunus trituberculatus]
MDKRKREGPLFSHGRERQGGKNGGVEEEEEDLFGDDDEIFSMISEDSIWIEETQGQQEPQPSTSFQVGRPPPRPLPQSAPLERLPHFDVEAGSTWIYPVNYPLRDYQYSMVESALYRNTLISLPTGLGKTFIAAVVMYNFYRWYPSCKVVFMAPTKPLVSQQIEACFNIMGIPQEDISQMTASYSGLVVRELKEHGHDFRILALSATPGSDLMAVKQVLSNLYISHVELRSEDSPDIQAYTFQRSVQKMVVPLGEELTTLKNRYLKVLRVYVTRLLDLNVLHTRDETTLTKFQLLKSRECFRQNIPSNLPHSKLGVVEGLFAMCMTLYHSYELMLQHGTRSFYRFLKEALNGEKGNYFLRGELRNNNLFQSIMNDLSKKFEGDCVMSPSKQNQSGLFSVIGSPQPTSGAGTSKAPFVISHPKMAKLQEIVLEHHQKFANEGKSTRIIIFSQYRESVMEITEMLQQHHPTVKAMSFIGHGTNSQSRKGLSQKKQLEVVSKFRGGDYNTLVSTCVGEEGLDIGDVDLIVCYDAPKSPIRLVQRMGRTGRQREGRIVVLVTVGKEEQNYNASQHQKKTINNALANTSKLARYLTPSSPRMVPSGLSPSCLKLHMKVDAWKTNIKAGKGTPRGRGSILSMMSRTSAATSKAGQRASWMSQEEWQWCRNNKVPQEDIRTLPPPSLMCLDASKYTFDRKRHINLGSYQPWQTLPQKTHLVGHSPLTRHLVEVTEFIGLQQLVGADEDPYGLEMAAFLDKAYVEDDEDIYHLSPDFKKSNNRQDQEDKIENKRKRKQNALTNKRKKPKVVQSSLITDMFSKMTQSQAKNREDNHSKEEATTRRVVVSVAQTVGASKHANNAASRGGTQHSASTPKLVSKRLFKKFTPGLSAVGEFSPIPWKDSSASPSGVGHSSMRGGKGQQDTPQQAAPCRDPCNRFRSKLSRFAKPEVPESESIAEITNADKSKAVNEIPVRKAYHVLGSDQEDSILTSDSEKDVSKASTTSGSSRTSTVSTCVTAPVRRAVAEQMRSQFDDEDDDFVQGPGHPPSKQQKVNSILKKRKKKRRVWTVH